MSTLLPARRLIPRWRRVAATLALPEGQADTGAPSISAIRCDQDELIRAIDEWKAEPTAGHLGHVLAFSIAGDCLEAVRTVAADAIRRGNVATPPQKQLIASMLHDDEEDDRRACDYDYSICNPHVRERVREVRALLRINPSNPLVLLDFAQFQVSSGKFKHAERSLLSALHLSPNNRLIVRTLARYYVHLGKPEQGHLLLARHARTPKDPWLMAGEIAIAQVAGVGSIFAKRAFKAVREKRKNYSQITELAGAVAGLEMASGNWRIARELFGVALLNPNDNVVAQAITDRNLLALNLAGPEQEKVVLAAAEARTLISWLSLESDEAESHAMKWHAEEPFSSRPLQFLTALCAVKGQYESAAALARRGLISDPSDAVLTANLSYALACLGRLEEAEKMAAVAQSLDHARVSPQTTATLGLVAMKRGFFDLSDQLYAKALSQFELAKRKDMIAICYAYYARAAVELDHPEAHDIVAKAAATYKEAPTVDSALILRRLKLELEAPTNEEPTRRLSQWFYEAQSNSMIRRTGLTKPGAPPVVFTSGQIVKPASGRKGTHKDGRNR